MSTVGQFSAKNPTVKRILKEASEIAHQPSADCHAAPLESDLFEWHFTLRGPPSPSPFAGGIYHGKIVLPAAYPLKPPSFRFLTPNGRFEVNREICLSISGHHEETWQPAWGIRTALVAIRSFMDTDANGQLGGMDASQELRKRMAGQSKAWRCPVCAKTNELLMHDQEEAVKEQGVGDKPEAVPEELRLAYRDDLGKSNDNSAAQTPVAAEQNSSRQTATSQSPKQRPATESTPIKTQVSTSSSVLHVTEAPQANLGQLRQQQRARPEGDVPRWVDHAIYGILAALVFLISKKWLL